jgi:molybdopterin-containing oxidoreductase family iron-sulfur binding subunit
VFAAYHTGEGLNAQIYNRCVGTRYCSNNCPYKVRRFNWFDHEWPEPMDKMLNPDISVRTKGIMEKCTFCVQRIRSARDTAKDESRKIRDGEVIPACAQTCPTRAIVFGSVMDGESRVHKMAEQSDAYRALESLGTKPSVYYITKKSRKAKD